jgi:hypothetical protein
MPWSPCFKRHTDRVSRFWLVARVDDIKIGDFTSDETIKTGLGIIPFIINQIFAL